MKRQKVKCPTCGKFIEWSAKNRWRPFCSERCRVIDLESYRIKGNKASQDHNEKQQ